MTTQTEDTAEQTSRPADARSTVAGYVRSYLARLRSGELGSLPILLGLILIAVIFGTLEPVFLSSANFVNLIQQTAGLATIAMGVVFVLLVADIDLSVSYVSAVGGVSAAILLSSPGSPPAWPVIGFVVVIGLGIGLLHGVIITKARVPSFVVTLAGFLAWSGVLLILIGGRGTVVIQDPVVVGIANFYLPDLWSWSIAGATVAGYGLLQVTRSRARSRAQLPTEPTTVMVGRVAGVAVLAFGIVYLVNQSRGLPLVGVLVVLAAVAWSFVANRTRFGRHIYAVGGNAEAARRAGINVDRIRIAVFMISSTMAVLGGLVLASRLRSVDTGAGGGNLLLNAIAAAVIGGTSLFGGHGRVIDALLGALVIASVENGMGLLGLSAGARFVVTGLILLAAVVVDSTSRRGRSAAGLA